VKTPIQYAEEIMKVLSDADLRTAEAALEIARALSEHKTWQEYETSRRHEAESAQQG